MITNQKHIPPQFYKFQPNLFNDVNECRRCGIRSLYEDFHSADSCWNCGASGHSKKEISAIWIPDPIITKSFLVKILILLGYKSKKGRWLTPEEFEEYKKDVTVPNADKIIEEHNPDAVSGTNTGDGTIRKTHNSFDPAAR